jgi:hypothetical protein
VLVSWTVSVALHIALLGLASARPWLVRLPAGTTQQPSDHRKLERIQFLAVAVPTEPVTRRRVIGQGMSQPKHTPTELTTVDIGIARDSASGEQAAPSKTPVSESAPPVDAPSAQRAWLTPSQSVNTGARGATVLLNEFVRAAIAAAADSLGRAREQERKAMDWTLKRAGGFRLGISPMRVHLGLLDVPVPVYFVSMRDFDQQSAGRRRMEAEIREQSNRVLRDSIVSARIRAIRERSAQAGRVPQ